MAWGSVEVRGGSLEVLDSGSGEPVLFIQTALTADELLPVATQPPLDGYRRIVFHRRGYGGSSPPHPSTSIGSEAADCAALLRALGVERAHVIGLSFSGAIALELAAGPANDLVHSLTLIEPPPVHTPNSADFRTANLLLLATRRDRGERSALDWFLTMVLGAGWQQVVEERLPGAVEQMHRDAGTFLDVDLPALLAWDFSPADAARIGCPVLYIGGTDSGPWFEEVHRLLLDWFPRADDVLIDGAGHSLALSHPRPVAEDIAAFLGRNPLRRPRPGSSGPATEEGP